jgi:peptide/nickel transport system substrate-binding protein
MENSVPPRRLGAAVASIATLALLSGTGCGLAGRASPQDVASLAAVDARPQRGGRMVVAVTAESNGWNPFINQWTDSGTLVGTSMIEPMVVQDNDGRVQPWLVEAWEPNSDFTQWTLSIRPNVLFHDGTPLDALVIKKNLDASLHSGFHQVVRSLYNRSEVIGPLELRVHLSTTWAQYPTSLANEWVMSPAMLDRPDAGVTDPVGTGPFVFSSWEQGKALRARRWDRYWRRDAYNQPLPYLDEVEFRPIVDARTRERELRNRDIDVALSDTGDTATQFGGDHTVLKDYSGQRTYLMLNTAVGDGNRGNPFVNLHARRALAYATDRERIARTVGEGVQSTTSGFPADSPWALRGGDGYVPYDPVQARAEVERYRRDTGARELAFSVLGLAAGQTQQVLQALKANWAEVGIKAELIGVEAAKLTLLTAMGQYQASWFKLYDFPDPDQMNFYLSSANVRPIGDISVNFTHYASRRIDDNLKVLRESVDPLARKAASDDIIRETNEQVINLWLYDTPEALVAARQVQGLDGFRTHVFANNLPKPWLAEAWLER